MLASVRPVFKHFNHGRSYCHFPDVTKVLAPHSIIDYGQILSNLGDLESNFAARSRTPIIDLAAMKELNRIYRKAATLRRSLKAENECNPYELRQYQSLDVYFRMLKLAAYEYLVTLPNELNEKTPRGNEDTIILTKSFDAPIDVEDHVSIGRKLNVLRYEDKVTYYLANDAAKLELAVVRFLSHVLKDELKFKSFKNPDTCNSYVVQGVTGDKLPEHGFFLLRSFYMLTGGASLASFCAVRVNTSTHKKFMPEHFFTCARRYAPELNSSGLFGVCQRTDGHVFVTSTTAEEMWNEFDTFLRWMIELYASFGLDFRVCYKRAADLTLAECCRATIQLYSAHEKRFVDAARLSVYDTFVSGRLQILCHNAQRQHGLVYILDGVVISVPTLVACLLERSTDRLFIPDCIRPFMPK